jgi:hypothetical protein
MARLGGIQRAACALQSMIARQSLRFIQQQDTIEHLPASFGHRRLF